MMGDEGKDVEIKLYKEGSDYPDVVINTKFGLFVIRTDDNMLEYYIPHEGFVKIDLNEITTIQFWRKENDCN